MVSELVSPDVSLMFVFRKWYTIKFLSAAVKSQSEAIKGSYIALKSTNDRL